MKLFRQILTGNDCYRVGRTIVPRGVMIHSTGAENPWLNRYVAPDDGRLGRPSGRHWNQAGVGACVHAFIGRLADGSVAVYQTLPWNCRGWHCAKGSRGSANDTHIAFEICEDGLRDPVYFQAVYREAVELTAYLCRNYHLDPLADGVVICHAEGYQRGVASNHGDVLHWFQRFDKTMDDFRADVARTLEGEPLTEERIRAIVREEVVAIETERAKLPVSDWAKPHVQGVVGAGLMAKNDAGSIDRPQAAATRQELAAVAWAIQKASER